MAPKVVSATSVGQQGHKRDGFMKIETVRGDLQAAMVEALGHNHEVQFVQRDIIKQRLSPMYAALPKTSAGMVELQVMEHTVHRYFMQRYSLSLKPFEPHRPLNASELRSTQVLGDRAPAFVEEILKARFYHNGFTLEDAVSMIAVMEQFLYDDSVRRLQKAYVNEGFDEDKYLTEDEALQVLESFFHLTEDEGEQAIVRKGSEHVIFILGELHRVVYKRQKTRSGKALLEAGFSFDEVAHAAHATVLGAQQLFSDCEGLRAHMTSFDKKNTGRAKLADLYWNSESSGFDIRESKDWLRRMGVLDESLAWAGPQVIIPNYVQAASNCVLTTSLYRVCCPNKECNNVFSHLEAHFGRSTVGPSEIWPAVVEAIKYDVDVQDDGWIQKKEMLSQKLFQIAGPWFDDIPLHGRLFQQWLHFLKPQHCPYPHLKGSVEAINLKDCGGGCVIDDVTAEAKAQVGDDTLFDPEDKFDWWMSQWSLEEELVTAKSGESDLTRRGKAFTAAVVFSVAFFLVSCYGFKIATSMGLIPQLLLPKAPNEIMKKKINGSGVIPSEILGKCHDV